MTEKIEPVTAEQRPDWYYDMVQAAASVLSLWCWWVALSLALGIYYDLDADAVRDIGTRGFSFPMSMVCLGWATRVLFTGRM